MITKVITKYHDECVKMIEEAVSNGFHLMAKDTPEAFVTDREAVIKDSPYNNTDEDVYRFFKGILDTVKTWERKEG